MATECTLAALNRLDREDLDAVQQMLDACTATLLDPTLWGWVIGLTLVSMLVGALIGWPRGRFWAGLLWGAALGPIGWLIVGFAKPNLPECPECGHRNGRGAKVCRGCGIDLRKAGQRSQRSVVRAQGTGRGW
ncbi:hypothetical protein [Dokdonella koreensis]|uniref:Zinc ribbon domain-containing protein n=1 Tax=Dokdonella koreensis DS-123 TaxID=1300342 RepID=A0A160DT29_9GAMM|nr:hypothetical protein [Dokdonella koreensis]ANB17485.1 Hypothetical protein I596_1459 [Dokdonella koreensis DS-123]